MRWLGVGPAAAPTSPGKPGTMSVAAATRNFCVISRSTPRRSCFAGCAHLVRITRLGSETAAGGRPVPKFDDTMRPVQEIERAIEGLSEEELAEFRAWRRDRDIEREAVAGRLDALADEALKEPRSGKTRTL